MGANTKEFHKAATKTKESIEKILVKEEEIIAQSILDITKQIFNSIKTK